MLKNLWSRARKRIVVLDDFFPNLYTGFRVAEFNAYLKRYPESTVASTNPDFAAAHAAYAVRYPALAARVRTMEPALLREADLAYVMFLNNAHAFLPAIEAANVPFLLSLNPGGGFGLNEPLSDEKLDTLLASKLLRHIIVTQSITRSYLLARGVPDDRITLIYGGVLHGEYVDRPVSPRTYFPQKPALDVAFIAHKYMPLGANKGFPEFCALAATLGDDPAFAWHVVGHGFDDSDWPPALTRPQALTFHGLLEPSTTLWQFTRAIDVVVSPQRPFVLHAGNFDSFPTISMVEASLQGAAMVASDVLDMNDHYRDGVEVVVAGPDGESLAAALRGFKDDPARLVSIAKAGQARSRKLFATSGQLGKRFALLDRISGKPAS